MERITNSWKDIAASVSATCFSKEGKVTEAHAIIQIEGKAEKFESQIERVSLAEHRLMEHPQMADMKAVFKRYFLSDAVNQAPLVPQESSVSNISFIQQVPLNGSKVALWIYFVSAENVVRKEDFTVVENNGYEHLWRMGYTCDEGDSYAQADNILKQYEEGLKKFDASIYDNCIRTWFYVRDVDIQYNGLVVARRDFFDNIGLTKDTHYIASTGIGGNSSSRKAIHQLGTYAVKGLKPEQIKYLQAPSHMNRTSDYGVTFERATQVIYGDRSHIYVSGTASINNKGQVVHVGDIYKQTQRMWENVETLLKEGGHAWDDVMQIIVYLRDVADTCVVEKLFKEKFPDTPFVITLAPVCRPEWLVEMECISVKETQTEYNDF